MTRPASLQRFLAPALTAAAVVWLAALAVVGLRPAPETPLLIRGAAHGVAALVCHRRPERSFHFHGQQLPVCARCSGLYLSAAIGTALAWLGGARMPRHTRQLIAVAAVPTALTWLSEWLGIAGVSNAARAVAALPLGGAAGWLFVRMLRAEGESTTCAMIA